MCDLELQKVKLDGFKKDAFIIKNIALSQSNKFTAEAISKAIEKYSINVNIDDIVIQLEILRRCGYLKRSFPNYYFVRSLSL